MRVGLFIPCYVDQFFPQVGIATYELLTKLGCEVIFPSTQTCCGQPMANAGYEYFNRNINRNFAKQFSSFDYVVSPSGSCVLHIKEHVLSSEKLNVSVYELCEFLVDILGVEDTGAFFPHKVGLHISCHGQRGLGLSSMSERNEKSFSKLESLLKNVGQLEMCKTTRGDECCGFGGTFCITQEAISVQMGIDRIAEHEANEVTFITGADVSCLMHLDGILRRKKSPIKVRHIAEILNERMK